MSTIHCQIDHAEGSLLRLIGLIERRGFHIDGMALTAHSPGSRHLAIEVRGRDPDRCIDVLGRQIDRLVGVDRIRTEALTYPEAIGCTP